MLNNCQFGEIDSDLDGNSYVKCPSRCGCGDKTPDTNYLSIIVMTLLINGVCFVLGYSIAWILDVVVK